MPVLFALKEMNNFWCQQLYSVLYWVLLLFLSSLPVQDTKQRGVAFTVGLTLLPEHCKF